MEAVDKLLQCACDLLSELMRALQTLANAFGAMLQRWKQKQASERFWRSLERDAIRNEQRRRRQNEQLQRKFAKSSNSRLHRR